MPTTGNLSAEDRKTVAEHRAKFADAHYKERKAAKKATDDAKAAYEAAAAAEKKIAGKAASAAGAAARLAQLEADLAAHKEALRKEKEVEDRYLATRLEHEAYIKAGAKNSIKAMAEKGVDVTKPGAAAEMREALKGGHAVPQPPNPAHGRLAPAGASTDASAYLAKYGGATFKSGGVVKGSGAVAIIAHAGELVVPKSVVSAVLKSNAWIEHVKAVQKKHKVTFWEALKIAKGNYQR